MKRNLLMFVASLMVSTMSWAVEYDNTQLTNGDNSISLTCLTDGNGNYQMVIEGEGLQGLGGSYCNVNGVGGYYLNGDHCVVSSDNKTVTINIVSTQAPQLYTPLYVMMPGEVNFGELTIDWKTVESLGGSEGEGSEEGETEGEGEEELPAGTLSLKSGSNNVLVTTTTDGKGNYKIVITGEGLQGLGGSYCNVNGVGGYYLNGDHCVVSSDNKTVTIDIVSTQAPQLYTPLYVMMPGEVNFGQPTFDWVVASGEGEGSEEGEKEEEGEEETPEVPVRESQLTGDLKHFAPADATVRATYKITADENGNVTFNVLGESINFAEVQVLDKGNYPLTIAADKASASYTFSDIEVGTALYFRFLFSVGDMPGNEMTADGAAVSTTDPKVFYYVYSGATPVEDAEEDPEEGEEDPEEGEGETPTAISVVNSNVTAVVYDITGKIVKPTVEVSKALEGLSRGAYIVKTTNEVKKVVVK